LSPLTSSVDGVGVDLVVSLPSRFFALALVLRICAKAVIIEPVGEYVLPFSDEPTKVAPAAVRPPAVAIAAPVMPPPAPNVPAVMNPPAAAVVVAVVTPLRRAPPA
jgi:hypothetical protein